MSSDLQAFNADELSDAKTKLIDYNDLINDDFENIKKSVNDLESIWKGKAGDAVIKNFNDKLKKFAENRYKKQNSAINLINTINKGYEATEDGNSKLSSRFKS